VIGRLRPSCRNYRLRLIAQHNVYPASDPTFVVAQHAPGNRKLPHGTNPVTQGVVLINPWTAIRIGRWYTLRRVDVIRPIFLAWPDAEARLTSAYAMPGQPLATLDDRLRGALHESTKRVIIGGALTGRLASEGSPDAPESEPVTRGDEHVVAVLPRVTIAPPEPCISCAWCVDVCPSHLRPIHLAELCASRSDDATLLDHLPWCVDCGLCSHVCPSRIPLAQTLRRTVNAMADA
jgi:electron transport complex protein RnfC